MILIVAALAAFFVVEALKSVADAMDRVYQPFVRPLLALLVATCVVLVATGFHQRAVGLALGASGLAALAHRVHRALGALGDAQRVQVMLAGRRPRT